MRPLKLTVQGFTSFAERAEVDFADLDLFAITGPTGAGKTSILDAMTWALYGKTPRLGKCNSELISHGKNNVAVNFEFAVGMDRYRIARSARRAGAGQVRLERFRDGEWIPEDAAGVKDTGAAISRVVGLEFEAFQLSVMLPQGKFDEFLRGEHSKRREILKALLGLDIYDRMREMANVRCRELSANETALQQLVEREFSDATEERLKTIKGELRQQKKAAEEAEARLAEAQKLCSLAEAIDRNRASRAGKEAELTRAKSAYLKACDEARLKTEELDRLGQQLETVQRDHDGILVDERRAGELIRLKTRAGQLDRLILQHDGTRKSLSKTVRDLEAAKSQQVKIRADLSTAEESHNSAQQHRAASQKAMDELAAGGSADLLVRMGEELASVGAKQRDFESIEGRIAAAKQKKAELSAFLGGIGPEREAAEAALAHAKEREQDLTRHAVHRELRAGLKKGQPCPVCEQTVSVLPKIPAANEIDTARRRVKTCEQALQNIRDGATRAKTELDGIPASIEQLQAQRKRIGAEISDIRKRVHAVTGELDNEACARVLSSKIDAIRAAEKQLKQAAAKETATLNAALECRNRQAKADQAVAELATKVTATNDALARLAEEIGHIQPDIDEAGGRARIVADLEAIESARNQKTELADKLHKLRSAIAKATDTKANAEKNAAVLGERARSLRADIDDLTATLDGLETKWVEAIASLDLPEGDTATQRASGWQELARQANTGIQQRMADLKAQVATVKDKIERRAGLERQIQDLHSEWEIYDRIHGALRADRFIDYLLGRAYDDLCRRGSEHLLRLSGERYSFTAGKNTFNVKDGWNGDAERPAGTLSGGESFFASLALALALAESVSTFSADGSQAARLEALFLDEGVSTLDQDEALPAVVDALMNLQAGDRMIGVISHMENLAHRLPARIEVVKNHGRSTIRIEAEGADAQVITESHMAFQGS